MEAVFRVDGHNVTTREHAGGPWDPTVQHGGAPSALVTWAAEQLPTPQPMQVARITVDLMRPVPVAPLTFEAEVVREGRKIQLCAVRLFSNGVEVVRASVLKIRIEPVTLPSYVETQPLDLPGPDEGKLEKPAGENKFSSCVTLRAVRGGFLKLGPAAIWFRADRPMVEGFENSTAMRVALTSDFTNGVASVIDFTKWTFINADLSITLARQPVGDWILLNSQATLGEDGAGIAISRLADSQGYFGQAVQCLVVEPR